MSRYSFAFGEYVVRHARVEVDALEPGQALSKARTLIRQADPEAFAFEYDEHGTAAYFLDMIGPDGRHVELGELPVCENDQILQANCEVARRYNAADELVAALEDRLVAISHNTAFRRPSSVLFDKAIERARAAYRLATGSDPLSLREVAAEAPKRFLNHYRCSQCSERWTDAWSATCDDRCPNCDTATSPYQSDDLPQAD